MQDQVQAMLRGQLIEIIAGTAFLLMGLAACSIAALRRRSGERIFVWLGIWSTVHGVGLLTQSPAVFLALPHWMQIAVPYLNTSIGYLTVVIGFSALMELSVGKVRTLIQILVFAGLAVAVAGIVWFIFGGAADKFIPYNHAVTICGLFVIATVLMIKKLSDKFLVLLNRRVLAVGTLLFTLEALWVNLARPLNQEPPPFLGHLAFAVFLLSFGYVAVQIAFTNERRLLSIDNELELARQLQFSILPTCSPEVRDVRIAVAYQPMTAVAGDFYEFVPVDCKRVGFLVADVTGHGVPAALIASMIKVAMQSVMPCAHDPREVLRGLNRILFRQLHDQLVSAAYLWLDTENHKASYSAAGHPPLLLWREGELQHIESNGLLFGVVPDPDYPVLDLPIESGDRFLLYTDGVIEPDNNQGEFFGDRKLEQVIRTNRSRSPSELSEQLLSEIHRWQPASLAQQDDITLIVIDVI